MLLSFSEWVRRVVDERLWKPISSVVTKPVNVCRKRRCEAEHMFVWELRCVVGRWKSIVHLFRVVVWCLLHLFSFLLAFFCQSRVLRMHKWIVEKKMRIFSSPVIDVSFPTKKRNILQWEVALNLDMIMNVGSRPKRSHRFHRSTAVEWKDSMKTNSLDQPDQKSHSGMFTLTIQILYRQQATSSHYKSWLQVNRIVITVDWQQTMSQLFMPSTTKHIVCSGHNMVAQLSKMRTEASDWLFVVIENVAVYCISYLLSFCRLFSRSLLPAITKRKNSWSGSEQQVPLDRFTIHWSLMVDLLFITIKYHPRWWYLLHMLSLYFSFSYVNMFVCTCEKRREKNIRRWNRSSMMYSRIWEEMEIAAWTES